MKWFLLPILVLVVAGALLKVFEEPPPWTKEIVDSCVEYCLNDRGVYWFGKLETGELICACHSKKVGQLR